MNTQSPQTTDESENSQESTTTPRMGRLTFGDMYLELPVDGQHKANRKLLGVLGREVKDRQTDKPVFTFQQLADQLDYGDRRDVQNFHRDLRLSDCDVRSFVSRKATKHDRVFPMIEAAILETPLLPSHQQYLSFCEDHPDESVSEETFRKYANEIDGVKILKRVQQVVKRGTDILDLSRYLAEVLACDRLSHAKKKEIVAIVPESDTETSSTPAKKVTLTHPPVQKKLLVVLLFACNVSQEVLGLLMGISKTSIHYWIAGLCTEEFEWRMLREITCWSGQVSFDEKWVKIKGDWFFVLSLQRH